MYKSCFFVLGIRAWPRDSKIFDRVYFVFGSTSMYESCLLGQFQYSPSWISQAGSSGQCRSLKVTAWVSHRFTFIEHAQKFKRKSGVKLKILNKFFLFGKKLENKTLKILKSLKTTAWVSHRPILLSTHRKSREILKLILF